MNGCGGWLCRIVKDRYIRGVRAGGGRGSGWGVGRYFFGTSVRWGIDEDCGSSASFVGGVKRLDRQDKK